MKEVLFDFDRIGTAPDFYKIAKGELGLPEYFGDNLDALWDSLTGDVALPLTIRFINLSLQQLDTFNKVIQVFEDAAVAMPADFYFEYFLKKNIY